eukprot:1706174-Rhodomonas_salina.2
MCWPEKKGVDKMFVKSLPEEHDFQNPETKLWKHFVLRLPERFQKRPHSSFAPGVRINDSFHSTRVLYPGYISCTSEFGPQDYPGSFLASSTTGFPSVPLATTSILSPKLTIIIEVPVYPGTRVHV